MPILVPIGPLVGQQLGQQVESSPAPPYFVVVVDQFEEVISYNFILLGGSVIVWHFHHHHVDYFIFYGVVFLDI